MLYSSYGLIIDDLDGGGKAEHMRDRGVTEKGKKLFWNLLSATDLWTISNIILLSVALDTFLTDVFQITNNTFRKI